MRQIRNSSRQVKQIRKRQSWQTREVRLKIIQPDLRNFILLNLCRALQPTSVICCLFRMAGMQCRVFSPSLILKIQSSLTIVSWGKFQTFPMSCTVLVSSTKRKLISFSLVMRLSTQRMRYSQKQTTSPSIRLIGLLSIIRSSPKLYFTCTLQGAPSFQTSQLSTQLSSNMIAERQFSFQSQTASQLTPQVFESEATKSDGNLSPISTRSLGCVVGKFLTGAERLCPNRKRCLVGRVEQMLEWLKAMSIGSLVLRSQSKAQVSGIRMIGLQSTQPRTSKASNIRNIIIYIRTQRQCSQAITLLLLGSAVFTGLEERGMAEWVQQKQGCFRLRNRIRLQFYNKWYIQQMTRMMIYQ